MIDCTITEIFLKEKLRMCRAHKACAGCLLHFQHNGTQQICEKFITTHPKRAIQIVQDWSNKKPQKTMLDKFKEDHPNAPMTNEDIPKTCPCNLGYDKFADCPKNAKGFYIRCVKCWNRPYEEEQK